MTASININSHPSPAIPLRQVVQADSPGVGMNWLTDENGNFITDENGNRFTVPD